MRDTVFVGMPKAAEVGNLTRASLPVATKDTFLYAETILDFSKGTIPGGKRRGSDGSAACSGSPIRFRKTGSRWRSGKPHSGRKSD
jgi:hypothetical protein